MNTIAFQHTPLPPQLVDFVDFKWLMASQGHRVDAQRMQADPDYAQQCLALAQASTSDLLRSVATRLLDGAQR